MDIIIKNENKNDHRIVEELTREAFGTFMFRDAANIFFCITSEKARILFGNLILSLKKMAGLSGILSIPAVLSKPIMVRKKK